MLLLASILGWSAGLALLGLGAMVFWPRTGLAARWQAARQLAERRQREDALKHLLHHEANQKAASLESLAGILQIPTEAAALLVDDLEKRGLLRVAAGQFHLTDPGRELALHIVRAHRLWESYLADQTGLSEAEWHRRAELQEHLLSPAETEALAARLGHPMVDPHGDAIPETGGMLAADAGQKLNDAPVGTPLQIIHLEDEPTNVYAQLVALGLRPGIPLLLTEKSPHRLRFFVDGQEQVLAPILAENISVAARPETRAEASGSEPSLASLTPGQSGRVVGLTPACRGAERRRLLDLGFVPGTTVTASLVSPTGDPVAYQVRGASIALRRDQAHYIRIAPTA